MISDFIFFYLYVLFIIGKSLQHRICVCSGWILCFHSFPRAVKDKDTERRRQEQLAKERLEAARLRRKEGRRQGDDGQLSVIANDLETEEDISKLQEMALTSLDLKHQSERELLMTVSFVWVSLRACLYCETVIAV